VIVRSSGRFDDRVMFGVVKLSEGWRVRKVVVVSECVQQWRASGAVPAEHSVRVVAAFLMTDVMGFRCSGGVLSIHESDLVSKYLEDDCQ
jgi:hypothetical protein